jgi:hypothetical protein
MKRIKYITSLMLLSAFLWTCWTSFMIYTSLMSESLPWYEPCGMQFLAILVISCPAMILIGIGELILGRFVSLSRTSKTLPFCTAAVLGLLVFADGSLGFVMQIAGATTSIIAAIASVVLFVLDAIKWRNPKILGTSRR